jgi:demethylmenaquinone methyltransferase / 2-methoxy-6-polyprenyl-1,4-benzoquinol methylase
VLAAATLATMSNERSDDREERVAPHPHLGRYYRGGEEGRRDFVRDIFDHTAGDYDRVERWMALGSGSWYRRRALVRSGLAPGMRVLDVATGTGLVAREAIHVTGDARLVTGLDPSAGMLAQARRTLTIAATMGLGEALPLRGESFDVVSMGYALRHLSDLAVTFREFHRVLRTGGKVCILELTPPRFAPARLLLRLYVRGVIPALTRLRTHHRETALLWQYFWDTMEVCVPPARVLGALRAAGFAGAARFVELGFCSEYTARKEA